VSKEEIIEKIVRALTLDQVEKDAIPYLWKAFEESYQYLKEKGLKASIEFEKKYDKVKKRPGLMDAWLNIILLSCFASGIASGKKKKNIDKDDVDGTKEDICWKWPECPEERISKSIESLDMLIEWYDSTQK